MYYLDTSAWLKRYYDEAGSAWVRSLFREEILLACATLGLVEVYATLARKRKAAQLSAEAFRTSTLQVERDWLNFTQIEFGYAVLNQAKQAAQSSALRGADAIHLGSVIVLQTRLGENDEQLILVTSDQELKTAAMTSGIQVLDPVEQPEIVPPDESENRQDEA